MRCPVCGCEHHVVIETRRHEDEDGVIRRRRKCGHCQFRWSTAEVPVNVPASVTRLAATWVVRRVTV